tara:strand:+ start:281 stop:382 length:102 start_codon:yes stop_codon:yes gene_type:complete
MTQETFTDSDIAMFSSPKNWKELIEDKEFVNVF